MCDLYQLYHCCFRIFSVILYTESCQHTFKQHSSAWSRSLKSRKVKIRSSTSSFKLSALTIIAVGELKHLTLRIFSYPSSWIYCIERRLSTSISTPQGDFWQNFIERIIYDFGHSSVTVCMQFICIFDDIQARSVSRVPCFSSAIHKF